MPPGETSFCTSRTIFSTFLADIFTRLCNEVRMGKIPGTVFKNKGLGNADGMKGHKNPDSREDLLPDHHWLKTPLLVALFSLPIVILTSGQSFGLTLEECVDMALNNNPDLQKQQLNQDVASTNFKEMQAQNYGTISAIASYTHYNLPRTLVPVIPATIFTDPTGLATTQDLSVTGLLYEVPLFTGFAQTNRIDVADLQRQMSAVAFELSQKQLIYNVKTLYINGLALESQIEAQASYIKALQQLYTDISLELQLGKRARIDQLKAAADLERAKAQKAQISSSLTIVKATLASLINVQEIHNLQDIAITVNQHHPNPTSFDPQLRELRRYRASQLEVLKSEKLMAQSDSTLYPQIAFNAFYGQNYGPNDSSNAEPDDWQNEEVWQAGVTMRWDIIDFGKSNSSRQRAHIAKQQSIKNRQQTELALKRDFKEAVTRINTAIIDYNSAQTELAMTRETESIEEVRFEQGTADLNDLLQAKARNQLALSRYINAGYTYKNAQFYLEYLLEKGDVL